MPPPDPPTIIQLKVKVPPGYLSSTDEFPLGSVETSSIIGSLRQQIQQLIPTHPAPERQRLLYGGRALVDNEQTVADALNTKRDPVQTEYVIHLLVKGEQGVTGLGAAGAGHRRAASQPASRARAPQDRQEQPQQQQQTPGLTPQGQIPANPPYVHHQHVHAAHQHELARQIQMQQQMWFQQMAQAQMNGGRMPPFVQQPMGGMQMPPGVQLPQRMPQQNQPGWPQVVAGNQQMRAGMGMQGVGGQLVAGQEQQNSAPAADRQNQAQAQQQQTAQNQEQGQQQQGAGTASDTAANPQSQQQQQHGQRRPISGQGFHLEGIGPNGHRFQISQQTLNIPHGGMGMPMMPQLPGMMPGMAPQMPFPPPPAPQQQPQPNGVPSALERARENVTEMRRLLDEMRNQSSGTEELRARIGDVQERAQSLNDYIDPLHLGGNAGGNAATAGRQSTSPGPQGTMPRLPGPPPRLPPGLRIQRQQGPPAFQNIMPHQQMQVPSNPNEVTAYLLSSPQGPQALLFSPQHGTYTGTLTQQPATTGPRPTPTSTALQHGGAPRDPAQPPPAADPNAAARAVAGEQRQDPAAAAAAAIAAAQQQNAAPGPLAPIQPILAHFWLLLRILIFVYFILGSNMGWQRPMILLAIGLGFMALRAGFLGDGRAVRRWWEGIVGVPGQGQRQGPQQRGDAQGQPQLNEAAQQPPTQGQDANAIPNPPQRRQPTPTPEQVAQRLLNDEDAARNQRWTWLREQIRPVERAMALFVASLWPGVGEAHVRAREEEQRRLAEAEVQRRRREEEERERERASEGEKNEGGEKKEDEKDGGGKDAGSMRAEGLPGERGVEGEKGLAESETGNASAGSS